MVWSPNPKAPPLAQMLEAAARVQIKLERRRILNAALKMRDMGFEAEAQKILAALAAPKTEENR